jgi:hypothetical protein
VRIVGAATVPRLGECQVGNAPALGENALALFRAIEEDAVHESTRLASEWLDAVRSEVVEARDPFHVDTSGVKKRTSDRQIMDGARIRRKRIFEAKD